MSTTPTNWSSKVQSIFSRKDKLRRSPSHHRKSSDACQSCQCSSPSVTKSEAKEISATIPQGFESCSVTSSGYFSQDSPRFEENNLQFKIDHLKSEFQTLSGVDQRLHKQLLALNNVIQDIRDFQRTHSRRRSMLETCIEEENEGGEEIQRGPKKIGHRRLQSEDFTTVRSPNLISQTEFRAIAEHGNSTHELDARTRS
eukprot:TRINITY_DN8779_c0_g1_i1.p1 TRINITY_DN8779_c0_g1~~TRINITY_DN8779_c0_g1_i1.p1  ORF type:complete len:199 (-),score=23.32 TRINITY_DN8779_c0_g1_i1:77-673(-)